MLVASLVARAGHGSENLTAGDGPLAAPGRLAKHRAAVASAGDPVRAAREQILVCFLSSTLSVPAASADCADAERRVAASGRPELRAYLLGFQSVFDGWVNRYDEALAAGRRALQLVQDPDDPAAILAHGAIGGVSIELGDFDGALLHLRAGLASAERTGDVCGVASLHSWIGRALTFLGDYRSARDETRLGAAVARQCGDVTLEMQALWMQGLLELEAERPEAALAPLEDGLRLGAAAHNPYLEQVVRLNLADAEARLQHSAKAREHIAATRAAVAAGVGTVLWTPVLDETEGRVLLAEGRAAEAAAMFERAADSSMKPWLTVRSLLGEARARRAAGDLTAALAVYRRAISQVETQRRRVPSSDDQRGEFLAANSAAYREAVDVLWRLRGAAALEEAFGFAEAGRARALLDALQIAGSSPAHADVATVAAVRAGLAPTDLLVEYVETEQRLYAFALSRAGGRWLELPAAGSPRDLVARVGFFRQLVQEATRSSDIEAVGERLYADLIAPILVEAPGIERLVLSPDGALQHLPFAALHRAGGRFLVAEHELSYTPSASFLLAERPAVVGPRRLLALAAPIGPRAEELGALPWAVPEAEAAASALGGDAELLSGARASQAELVGVQPRQFEVLHFATHATIDSALPLRSALLLSPSPGGEGELRAAQIYNWTLGARLVVLSACASANGPALRGEGVQSLARAFLHAGAASVVATLWPVEDRASEQLMETFYRGLGAGLSVSAALARADRDSLAANAPPRVWADFEPLGRGEQTISRAPFRGALRWVLAAALALAGWIAWRLRG